MSDLGMTAVLAADITPFEAGMLKAAQVATNFASSFAKIIKNGTQDAFEGLYKQGRLADSMNASVSGVREFQYALDKFGIGAERAKHSIQFFESGIGKALGGAKAQQEAFKNLGLSAVELGRMDPIEALQTFTEAVAKLPTAAQRLDAERAVFGRGARELMPLIGKMKEARAEFRSLFSYSAGGKNFEIGLIDTKKIEIFYESINKIKYAFGYIYDQLAIKFSPVLTNISNQLIKVFSAQGTSEFIDRMISGIQSFGNIFIEVAGRAFLMFKNAPLLIKDIGGLLVAQFEMAGARIKSVFEDIANFINKTIGTTLMKIGNELNSTHPDPLTGMIQMPNYPGMGDMGKKLAAFGYGVSQPSMSAGLGLSYAENKNQGALEKLKNDFFTTFLDSGGVTKRAKDFWNDLFKDGDDAFMRASKQLDENRAAREAYLIEIDKTKEKKVNPLGYALGITSSRQSITAMQLAGVRNEEISVLKQILSAVKNKTVYGVAR